MGRGGGDPAGGSAVVDDALVEARGFFFPELDGGGREAEAAPVRRARDPGGEAESELGDAGGEGAGFGRGRDCSEAQAPTRLR